MRTQRLRATLTLSLFCEFMSSAGRESSVRWTQLRHSFHSHTSRCAGSFAVVSFGAASEVRLSDTWGLSACAITEQFQLYESESSSVYAMACLIAFFLITSSFFPFSFKPLQPTHDGQHGTTLSHSSRDDDQRERAWTAVFTIIIAIFAPFPIVPSPAWRFRDVVIVWYAACHKRN